MPVSFACRDWLVLYSAGAWKGEGRRALDGLAPWCMALVNKRQYFTAPVQLCSQHDVRAPAQRCMDLWIPFCLVPRWPFSKPRAYAAIYLFRPLCRLMFRFALAGWSPQARSMSAVGRGVREEGLMVTGRAELSVLKMCLLFFQRVLFIRLRERGGFKISLTVLWATLVDRIWLLRPGRSSSNFSFWAKWTSVAFHCFTA